MSIFNSTMIKEPKVCGILRKVVTFSTSNSVVATTIGTSILNAGFGLFAIGANLLVMVVIYRKGSTRLPADLFIANLSLTDFLVGLLVQPFHIIVRLHVLMGVHLCTLKKAYGFIGYLCCGASMLTICCFSLDRAIAVASPYIYKEEASNKKSAAVIIMCWLFCLLFTVLPFTGVISNKSYFICLSCFILLSVAISCICYINIMIVVRRHMKKIAPVVPPCQPSTAADDTNTSKRKQIWLWAQKKKSLTSIVIACVFAVCFIPKVCVLVAFATQDEMHDVVYVASNWSNILVFINSSLNPIIYAIRITEIREDMITCIQLLKSKICVKRNSVENVQAA